MPITTACWYKLEFAGQSFYMKETPEIKWLTGMEKTVIAGAEGSRCEGMNTGHSKDVTVTIYNTLADNFKAITDLCELPIGASASANAKSLKVTKMQGSGASWGEYKALPKDPSAILQTKDGGHFMNVTFEVYDAIPSL